MWGEYLDHVIAYSVPIVWLAFLAVWSITCVCAGVTEYIETGSGSDDALSGLETDEFPEENVRTVFSGALCVLTAALRHPRLKSEVRFV